PSPHVLQMPQSCGQLAQDSSPAQTPSPHPWQNPQSGTQFMQFSPAPQTPSPQGFGWPPGPLELELDEGPTGLPPAPRTSPASIVDRPQALAIATPSAPNSNPTRSEDHQDALAMRCTQTV